MKFILFFILVFDFFLFAYVDNGLDTKTIVVYAPHGVFRTTPADEDDSPADCDEAMVFIDDKYSSSSDTSLSYCGEEIYYKSALRIITSVSDDCDLVNDDEDYEVHTIYDTKIVCDYSDEAIGNPIYYNDKTVSYFHTMGRKQICSIDTNTCYTTDRNGNKIDNLPINGVIYDTIEDVNMNRLLTIGATGLAVVAGSVAIVGSGGTLLPATVATYGTTSVSSGIFATALGLQGTPYNINSNDSDNNPDTVGIGKGISINLNDYDFSKENPSVDKYVDSEGNEVSRLITSDGSKQELKTVDDNVILDVQYPNNDRVITEVPLSVLTEEINNDDNFNQNNNGSNYSYKVTTSKNDEIQDDGTVIKFPQIISEYNVDTSNNVRELVSQTTVGGSVSASSTNGSSSTVNQSVDEDGNIISNTSNDYAPVTNRLNQIIAQNSLSNSETRLNNIKVSSKLDSIVSSFETSTSSITSTVSSSSDSIVDSINSLKSTNYSKLGAIKTTINNKGNDIKHMVDNRGTDIKNSIDTQGSNIVSSLNDISSSLGSSSDGNNTDVVNAINSQTDSIMDVLDGDLNSTSTNDYNFIVGEFSTFKNNIFDDLNSTISQINSVKDTLNNGFSLELPSGTVDSCPYEATLTFHGKDVPFKIDVCSIISPVNGVLYILFYIGFFIGFLRISFFVLLHTFK
jgi:hypothetical protein